MTDATAPSAERHDKMLSVVAKLLRQAEDAKRAGRDAEAKAFQEKAFQIMADYGISAALARARMDGLDITSGAEAESVYLRLEPPYLMMQCQLAWQMAMAMHCKAIRLREREQTRMRVYGMLDHLRRLADMWRLLAPQAQRGMENAHPGAGSTSSEVTVYRRSWMDGFIGEVCTRIRKAENSAAAAEGALVLYKTDGERADLAMQTDYPDSKNVQIRRQYDPLGYQQGELAAKAAHLHRVVE